MTVTVNGVKLNYEVTGAGTPLILLHGNGGDHTIFAEATEKLKARFTVYALDTRGHGQSQPVTEFHYEDMAQDVHDFVQALSLDKPVLYGYSDGGIIGLLVAAKWPTLLSKLVVSGANTVPSGLKFRCLAHYAKKYLCTRDKKYLMVLKEPHIADEALQKIAVPTFVLAGSGDIITLRHTKHIQQMISGSRMKIFDGETHGSYISHSTKFADYLLEVL